MPNIMINSCCNLNCNYCFSKKIIDNNIQNNISIKEFENILQWLKPYFFTSLHESLGIIGGEPTLHPELIEILNIASSFMKDFNTSVLLFTNGINLQKKILQFIPDNVSILINYNNLKKINQDLYNQLNSNLDLIFSLNWFNNNKVTLGLNLYNEEQDYSFFKDIILKYKIKKFRLAVAAIDTNFINLNSYYLKMKPIFLDIINFSIINGIKEIFMDCRIPISYFSEKEQQKIFQVINKDKYLYKCNPGVILTKDFLAYTGCDFNNYLNYMSFKDYPSLQKNFMSQCKMQKK